jgi:hypothetical protein
MRSVSVPRGLDVGSGDGDKGRAFVVLVVRTLSAAGAAWSRPEMRSLFFRFSFTVIDWQYLCDYYL